MKITRNYFKKYLKKTNVFFFIYAQIRSENREENVKLVSFYFAEISVINDNVYRY